MKKILFMIFLSGIVYGNRSFNWNIDNDIFLTDKFYTSGVEFEIELHDETIYNEAGEEVSLDYEGNKVQYSIRRYAGQKLFTPSEIEWTLDEIDKYERPYAGLLYGGYKREKYIDDGSYWKYNFLFGMTGDGSFGELYQKNYHEVIGSPEPLGWDSQIDESFVFLYSIDYSPWTRILYEGDDYIRGDYRYIVNASIGTLRIGGSGGVLFRFGRLLGDFEPGKAEFQKKIPKSLYGLKEYYIYANAMLKLNIHDTTYQGGLFENHSPFTVNIEPFVLEEKLGAMATWDEFSVDYALTMQSTEVEGEAWKPVWHAYHSLNFRFYY